MVNPKLRRELLNRLGITKQALSARVKTLKKKHPMTSEEAVYLIAFQERIPIDKYVDNNTIIRIGEIVNAISVTKTKTGKRRAITADTGPDVNDVAKSIKGFLETLELEDPILSENKIKEALEMAKVYPKLYVLENSIRELITKIMERHFGIKWWDKVPRELKNHVEQRQTEEAHNTWHQRRSSKPIDYLDLRELPRIVNAHVNLFVPGIFPTRQWFDELVDQTYKSRCVVCHMNPLSRRNITRLELHYGDWKKQVKGRL